MEREIPNCRPTREMHLASEVTERQLAELAGNLVKKQDGSKTKPWEKLLISLGLSSADLFRHKEENRFNLWGQCFYALVRWKRCYYKEATIERLLTECQRCNISIGAYAFLYPE